jgi:hypothetical protein
MCSKIACGCDVKNGGAQVRKLPFFLAAWLLTSPMATKAEEQVLQDIPQAFPEAMSAYRAIMPAAWNKIGWIYDLDAVTTSLDVNKLVAGKAYLYGWGCEPHNCFDNKLAIIIARDGTEAAAAILSQEVSPGKTIYRGSSKPELHQLLDLAITDMSK